MPHRQFEDAHGGSYRARFCAVEHAARFTGKSGPVVTITKGMLVRGEYPGSQYGTSVQLTH